MAVSFWFYGMARSRDDDIVRQRTASEARQVAGAVRDRIENDSRIVNRYARRWAQKRDLRRAEWDNDASLVMAQDSAFYAVAWVDSALLTRWVMSRTGMEGDVPHDLTFDPGLAAAILKARRDDDLVISHSPTLPRGGRVLALCAPMNSGGVPKTTIAFLEVDKVMKQSLSRTAINLRALTVLAGDSVVYGVRPIDSPVNPWLHQEAVELRGAVWRFQVRPEPHDLARLRSRIPVLMLIFGMTTGLFLSLLTWLSQTAHDRAVEVSSINRDLELEIEKRVIVERAMRESEARFRSVTESANEAIVIADEDKRIVFWNTAAERVFGRTETEALSQPLEIILPERHWEKHRAELARIAEGNEPGMTGRPIEIDGVRADGSEMPLEMSIATWTFDARRFYSGIMRDISHRRATEAQIRKINAYLEARVKERTAELKRSNEELQQFAYVASHDLQEPLRTVSSFTQLLAKRYRGKLGDEADEFIAFAVDGCRRMQDLINDLLLYCRVGTTSNFAPVDTEEALSQALANLRVTIGETGAAVRNDPLPEIEGDLSQIVQLFQNLIGNAIKFRGAERPQIDVSARWDGSLWSFSIRDNGIGMEPRHLQRIFVIFQRLHTREEYKGTGIGLAICKKIVERHEGKIWAESTRGTGSIFHFTLPPASDAVPPVGERLAAREASPVTSG